MTFDLGRIMQQKQERECARLDDFDFRLRARTIRIVATWGGEQSHDSEVFDPSTWVRQIATQSFETVLSDLRAALCDPVDGQVWNGIVGEAKREAQRSLICEFGDPTPIRLG